MADLLLAIDNGTQSVRALVFDATGELIARSRVVIDEYVSAQPGWHEYDPQRFWEKACQACRELWAQRPDLRERIAAVAVTTQRGTVVNLDRDGMPLRPAITWLDQRKSPVLPKISPLMRSAFRIAGAAQTVAYFQREAEANWIAASQPDVFERTHKYLLLSGYLNYRLSGEFVDSIGSQVGYLPFDFKTLTFAKPGDWKWQALRVHADWLPRLVEPGTVFGAVTSAAHRESGIAAGTPIVAAAADKACEVLGAGCTQPSTGCLSFGTTATINVASRRYLEATPLVPPYPGAIPKTYDLEVQIFRGYWMVNWFKQEFGWLEREAAARSGQAPETLFDALVESVPAGAMGLMLQPYWSPGLRMPEAKGAIIGFGDVHTRAHLYRAILEGLAYGLRDGKERIESRTKTAIAELRVCGGGSQSDAALQLTADIFGLPASRPHVFETSGLGAAIDAAVGLKIHPSFEAAVSTMTRRAETFEPDPGRRALYDALYRRVYRRLYDRLRPLYEEIRDITGYPPA
ncbi:MAG TPA: FGGY-family carbohydrate kinase [Candidatus Baltobacteraceae bacterium]|nr:FGGY-family carbohydrate kinase [Candidatus Baltobacteraceae bacterium]